MSFWFSIVKIIKDFQTVVVINNTAEKEQTCDQSLDKNKSYLDVAMGAVSESNFIVDLTGGDDQNITILLAVLFLVDCYLHKHNMIFRKCFNDK